MINMVYTGNMMGRHVETGMLLFPAIPSIFPLK
jgi:hypothetical protein